MNRKTVVARLAAIVFLASVSAYGVAQKVNGIITTRTGETLIVKSDGGGNTTVVLTDSTVTRDKKGLFGLDKEHLSSIVLIPGLKVSIDGTNDSQGRLVAKTITTDGDDLETAEMIQAGLHPTAQQVVENQQNIAANKQAIAAANKNSAANKQAASANQQAIAGNQQEIDAQKKKIEANEGEIEDNTKRFSALADYDVKGEATVNFNTGSFTLSPKSKADLKTLAQTAIALKGYIVEVTGYTDSTGSAAINTQLSANRAKAVIVYLMQQGSVPVRHIVAPGAMGEYGAAATNETSTGRAENRRVEVKVLVNKGISGS